MRFPIVLMHSERNDKLYSENAYNVFANILRAELYPKQAAAAVYAPRSIKYDDDSKQAVIQKFKDDSPPFRKWIDFLLNNDWIERCKDIMLFPSFKDCCTIATTKYNLQNKVASTKTTMFPDIAEGAKDCEN
jgi:hypothetical protein